MSVAIGAATLALIVGLWLVVSLKRKASLEVLGQRRQSARAELTVFASASMEKASIAGIISDAATAASRILGAHRFVSLEETEAGWVASQPVGPPPPAVPATSGGLFAWFKHNPFIACEVDLPKGRFGAMRSPLSQLMELYAVDVIMPLVDRERLLAVIGLALDHKPSQLDRELLRIFRLDITAACANVRLHHQAANLVSMAQEVDLASSIELAMVPEIMSGDVGRFRWAGHFEAGGQAGSDFWGIYPLEGGRMMLVMGDAVGQNIAGTMVSAVVKSACDEIFDRRPRELDPAQLLHILNDSLYRPNRPALTSCFAALFDPSTGEMLYANAGHVPPYHVAKVGDHLDIGVLLGSGPLLGDLSDPGFEVRYVKLQEEESFIFLTNGLLAPEDANGRPFGARGLQKLLRKQSSVEPEFLRASILEGLETHAGDAKLSDDQALLVVTTMGE